MEILSIDGDVLLYMMVNFFVYCWKNINAFWLEMKVSS